jgi:hypothetical protein
MSLPPDLTAADTDRLLTDHLTDCDLCAVRPGELFCAGWINLARKHSGYHVPDDGGRLRGCRIFADVLLDVSTLHIDGRAVPNPAERAAVQFLDVLKAADVNLCGALHVSRLKRDVNIETGEVRWRIAGAPEARITP